MNPEALAFVRPEHLEAPSPPEYRGKARDEVRLLVSDAEGDRDREFLDLPGLLGKGDLLVVNESATLAASLPARGRPGEFLANVSTDYGRGLYLVEPRWSFDRPGPLPLEEGEPISIAGVPARLIGPFPGLPRLWFVHAERSLQTEMHRVGRPIRYGYAREEFPLGAYQTIFGRVPGSAEMPSAARPFSRRIVLQLTNRGIRFASILLHTGVSSLEVEGPRVETEPLYPEPFVVSKEAADAVNSTRRRGNHVVAVGTTVVRALTSAWNGCEIRPTRGFSRRFVHPPETPEAFDAMLTGFHDPMTSHLALLYSVVGQARVRAAYEHAIELGYFWHEFGDSHLLFAS